MDFYLIVVTPRPLSHPVSNIVYSTPWNVTLDYNIEHIATITAVNCAGESSPFILTNIEFSKFCEYLIGVLSNVQNVSTLLLISLKRNT